MTRKASLLLLLLLLRLEQREGLRLTLSDLDAIDRPERNLNLASS